MKRISLLAVVALVNMMLVTNAYCYYGGSSDCQTHYSPYAFSPSNPSGLIPGGFRYSPYAFDYGRTGLVADYLQYSPYAFGYGKTGLIPDYVRYSPYAFGHYPNGLVADVCYGGYYNCYWPGPSYCPMSYQSKVADYDDRDCGTVSYHNTAGIVAPVQNTCGYIRASSERFYRPANSRQTRQVEAVTGGERVIYNYLKSRNINFQMNRLIKIDESTLCADFLLKNKNLLIRYSSPEDIRRVQQQGGYKSALYKNYSEKFGEFQEQYCKSGGKIYQIEASDEQEIVSKLKLCELLNEG